MAQRKIELAKPRDFGEVINDTFLFVRQNFKPLMKYFFTFCGFFVLATMAISVLTELKMITALDNFDSTSFNEGDVASRFSYLNLGFFINMFFLFLEYSAIYVTVLCYMTLYKIKQNVAPTTEEMWGYFKFYYLKTTGSFFILFILTMLGTALCIIPGIYLGVVFVLVAPIMIVENSSFGYAFNHCFRLIKDNWWVTFGALVVIGIILYVIRIVIVVPTTIISYASMVTPGARHTTLQIVITILSTVLEQLAHIFQILVVITTGLCYFNLSESKDGLSLMERINQFGSKPTDDNLTPEEY
jgi:hypothetical protein